jgi:hypothetical protein
MQWIEAAPCERPIDPSKGITMPEFDVAATKIDRLEGDALAVESLLLAVCEVLPEGALPVVQAFFASEIEAARQQLHNLAASPATLQAFEVSARRLTTRLDRVGN